MGDALKVTNPIIRAGVQLVSFAVVLVAVFVAYCAIAERSAEGKAREFCGGLQIGMSVGPLESRAFAAGASKRQTKWIFLPYQSPALPVTFTGAFPMSRHMCWVQGSPKLVKAEYVYLD